MERCYFFGRFFLFFRFHEMAACFIQQLKSSQVDDTLLQTVRYLSIDGSCFFGSVETTVAVTSQDKIQIFT